MSLPPRRLRWLTTAAVAALLLAWLARPHLIDHFRSREFLRADALDGDALATHLAEVPAPARTLATLWTSALLDRLSDPEPSVALAADAILRRWSRLDSGLRLTNALPGHRGILPLEVSTQTRERLAQAQRFWREWWDGQEPTSAVVLPEFPLPPPRVRLPDFELPDLQGRTHRLSEFRGK